MVTFVANWTNFRLPLSKLTFYNRYNWLKKVTQRAVAKARCLSASQV